MTKVIAEVLLINGMLILAFFGGYLMARNRNHKDNTKQDVEELLEKANDELQERPHIRALR